MTDHVSGLDWLASSTTALPRVASEAARRQEYWTLAGLDGPSPYRDALMQIDALIGALKHVRAEVQALHQHAHIWNAHDYCMICGADGAA